MIKTIQVAAAIIKDNNKIFVAQRGYGEFKGKWEFPGGKLETGETPHQALVREIKEELDAEIEIGEALPIFEYDYPQFHLILHCFWCSADPKQLCLKEHMDAKWLGREELESVDWLASNQDLVTYLKSEKR